MPIWAFSSCACSLPRKPLTLNPLPALSPYGATVGKANPMSLNSKTLYRTLRAYGLTPIAAFRLVRLSASPRYAYSVVLPAPSAY